jgi:hypothetical protein
MEEQSKVDGVTLAHDTSSAWLPDLRDSQPDGFAIVIREGAIEATLAS